MAQEQQQQHEPINHLHALAAAVDELHDSPDVDSLLRKAVQFARSQLGVERCRIFLNVDGVLQGTYGVDRHGNIADEGVLRITNSAHWIKRIDESVKSGANWTVIEDSDFKWDTPPAASSGWIALTPVRSGEKLIGMFVNCCALSGCPLDPAMQDAVAVFASLLGLVIEQKRSRLAAPATHTDKQPDNLFTRVIHASPVPIAVITLGGGIFLDMNARYLELMGYTRDELVGHALSNSITPITPEETARIGDALRGKNTLRDFETTLHTRNGEPRSVHLFIERVELDGKACIVAMIDDFTERLQAEKALSEERSLLRTVIDTLPDYIFAKDLNGRFIMSNAAHARAANVLDPDAFIGKQASDFFPQNLAAQFDADDREVLRTGNPFLNLERVTQNGLNNPIIVSTTKVPLRDPDGNIVGLVGISRDITAYKRAQDALQKAHDGLEERVQQRTAELSEANALLKQQITERKHAEEALQQAHDQLEQRVEERTAELRFANEEVKRFAYIVSHDLRAPLVNIKGFSNELQLSMETVEDALKPMYAQLGETPAAQVTQVFEHDIPEALSFISASVERMNYLINAILKFSRLGDRTLQYESIDTAELVRSIIQSLGHQIAAHKTSMVIGALPNIVADRTAMEQVFGNILSNAVLYLAPERPGTICITGESAADETIFHIQDNGRGIAPEDHSKVFELFRRGNDVTTPGEGMGLAYVQTLVRRHEGRIWFDSQPGVGTMFSFAIPHRQIEELVHA